MTDTGRLADSVRAEQQEFHRFGGTGPIVHIAHANGFPPGTYRLLAETLTSRYRVLAMPARPLWPSSRPESTPTWHPLASDLVHGLDVLGATKVIGIGHSLGGVLTLWAASQRPDLFEAAILIEPVILPPLWLWFLRLLRLFGLEKRLPLVQRAKSRRRTWPSRQACYEHYRRTPFFAQWPDEALHDYVTSGTRRSDSDTIELVYPPAWEAHIFASTPTGIWRDVPHLRVPTLVIRGESSEIFRPEALARMKRTLPQAQFVTLAGAGHLLPMEKAGETGAVIKRYLETFNTSKKAY
ncbi:MAG: alpha/beta hydrolase [Anaerolineae bacterium]